MNTIEVKRNTTRQRSIRSGHLCGGGPKNYASMLMLYGDFAAVEGEGQYQKTVIIQVVAVVFKQTILIYTYSIDDVAICHCETRPEMIIWHMKIMTTRYATVIPSHPKSNLFWTDRHILLVWQQITGPKVSQPRGNPFTVSSQKFLHRYVIYSHRYCT